jgi:hypothetical protein
MSPSPNTSDSAHRHAGTEWTGHALAGLRKDGASPPDEELDGSEARVAPVARARSVTGTLDGGPFKATLGRSGPRWLPLRAALRKVAAQADPGEQLAVHLRQRNSRSPHRARLRQVSDLPAERLGAGTSSPPGRLV